MSGPLRPVDPKTWDFYMKLGRLLFGERLAGRGLPPPSDESRPISVDRQPNPEDRS